MSASRWLCPVDGCPWLHEERHDIAEPFMLVFRPGASVDEAINDRVQQQVQARERVMREHLETHDVQEFAATIARLRHRVATMGDEQELKSARYLR